MESTKRAPELDERFMDCNNLHIEFVIDALYFALCTRRTPVDVMITFGVIAELLELCIVLYL